MRLQPRDLLLRELADGKFCSGQQLADAIGVSRTAVWKQVRSLEKDLGVTVRAVRGRGYRLDVPLELLDAQRIAAEFTPDAIDVLDAMHVLACTDSTNNQAAADPPGDSGRARVWLAEHQTAGRGRRGRTWVSTFGENLYLSLAWRFELPMSEVAGLSLVAGIVLAEVLQQFGLDGHALKWPNDILVDGRKLAGILVEASGEAGGPTNTVIGLGVNLRMAASQGAAIDQPWTDLRRSGLATFSRNQLAGVLVDGLIRSCQLFSAERLGPFVPRWERFDGLHGRRVSVLSGTRAVEGIYCGISARGGLLLENAAGRSEYHAGEVSLREASSE